MHMGLAQLFSHVKNLKSKLKDYSCFGVEEEGTYSSCGGGGGGVSTRWLLVVIYCEDWRGGRKNLRLGYSLTPRWMQERTGTQRIRARAIDSDRDIDLEIKQLEAQSEVRGGEGGGEWTLQNAKKEKRGARKN